MKTTFNITIILCLLIITSCGSSKKAGCEAYGFIDNTENIDEI